MSPQAKKERTGLFHFSREKLLYSAVNRTVSFFFFMSLLTLFLYAAGTAQEFIDSTQLFLLRLYRAFAIFLILTSIFGGLLAYDRFAKSGRKRYLLRAGGYVLLVIFTAATIFAVMAIIALSSGNMTV